MGGEVTGSVVLKKNRAKPVLQRHPWVYSGAIQRIDDGIEDGDIVDVRDAGNNWLSRGYVNRHSQIVVRLLTWNQAEPVDGDFWRRRLAQAKDVRLGLAADISTTAYRVVHAESDYLPGLVVDLYGEWLVAQFLTLGMERRKAEIVSALVNVFAPKGVYERSDVDARALDGLEKQVGLLWGEEPPETVEVLENANRFVVDVRRGQKTGFYLDQRENRARLASVCTGAEVLDAFAYSGACSAYAASGSAGRVTLVESSGPALEMARRNLAYTRLKSDGVEYVEGNVFSVLRGFRAQGRRFNIIVLDPPKFASSEKQVRSATRAYKDVNRLAFQLLRPSGTLFTTSCSGAVSPDLFQKVVFAAAIDAGRQAQIIGSLSQSADHPVALTFPQGAYLKGLIARVV